MNTLKFNLGLLSLLGILAVSVLLVSCEQDALINPAENTLQNSSISIDNDTNIGFVLPEKFNDKSVDEVNEYINSLTPEQFENGLEEIAIDQTTTDREACTSCYYYWQECTSSCNGLPHRNYWYQKCVYAGRTVYLYCGYYTCSN